MVNIGKHVEYWRQGAAEDFEFGAETLKAGKARYGLFFGHLALEKALKAHVCRATGDLAPKTHDLVALAKRADLELGEDRIRFLGRVNAFNIEGRYPESLPVSPSPGESAEIWARLAEVFQWLIRQL